MLSKIDVLISQEEIEKRITEMAKEVSSEYEGRDIILVGVLKGSVMFMVDFARKLTIPNIQLEFMDISSYGDSTVSSGNLTINKDLDIDIEGKHVIVLEDIVDTGRTLKYLLEYLTSKKPASFKLCTLLDKPSRRIVEVKANYVGFTIPDEFVLGYGLDYMQKYRNLPYIGVMKQ